MSRVDGFRWCPHCGAPHALSATTCPKTGTPLAEGTQVLRGLRPDAVVVDRYRVREKVGEESIAFLYEAVQRALDRRVLLKVVHSDALPEEDCDAEIREMEREARVASLVEHPNVAPILDFGHLGRHEAFLVRERSRSSLASRLRVSGPLRVEDAADLIMQVLSGLQALHDEGVLHRDLGSHNVRLSERAGCPALARIAGLGRASSVRFGVAFENPSGIHYASPEILRGLPTDQRSDIFSCGAILYEMLSGRRPFEGTTPGQVTAAILRDHPPPLAHLRPTLDHAWSELLERALSKDAAARFESPMAFLEALPTQVRTQRSRRLDGTERLPETLPPPPPDTVRDVTVQMARVPITSKCDRYIGQRIAKKYEIESLLGSGSAGAVYRATHIDLRRPVAVKVLHDWNRTSEQFVQRFKAEAFSASKLDHPNVTRIIDCGEEPDGTLYLVMEYIDGPSLEGLIASEGRLKQERAVSLAVQIVGSLAAAHERGIIHRDVKPDNVMLLRQDGAEIVKVCDFGLAKLFDGAGGPSQELTSNGLMLGSPGYMAPEQIRGEPSDERTDLYAAGVTLYELLTGHLPHEAASLAEIFHRKLNEPPTPMAAFVKDIDPLLNDIVIHALEPRPAFRHRSASDLRIELAEVLEELRDAAPTDVITLSVPPDPCPPSSA